MFTIAVSLEPAICSLVFPGQCAKAADFLLTRRLLFAGEAAVIFSWPKSALLACMSEGHLPIVYVHKKHYRICG